MFMHSWKIRDLNSFPFLFFSLRKFYTPRSVEIYFLILRIENVYALVENLKIMKWMFSKSFAIPSPFSFFPFENFTPLDRSKFIF